MNTTKTDMARVITKALYNMPVLPGADHWKVKQLVRDMNKDTLREFYIKAERVLADKMELMYRQGIDN